MLDAVLVFIPLWCLVVPILFGKGVELPLPFGGAYGAKLSPKHLTQFWVLLFVRQHLRSRSGNPGWVTLLARSMSGGTRAVAIGLLTMIVYLAMVPRPPISGDTVPAKLVPVSILEEGDLDLDEFYGAIFSGHRYSLTSIGGHFYPAFPVFVGLTALPVYGAFSLLAPESFATWRFSHSVRNGDTRPNVVNLLEQCSAAALAALSVVVVWKCAELLSRSPVLALWITVAYGLGTPILSSASWALWTHGPSCLFLALTAWLVIRPGARPVAALLLAGAAAGSAYACRPTNAVVIAVLFVWVIAVHRGAAGLFLLSLAVVFAAVALLNHSIYQDWRGAYGAAAAPLLAMPKPAVLATILFSPSRGLFVFSPFLLFAVALAVVWPFRRPRELPAYCLLAALASAVLVASYGVWSGGHSFGPRLLSEAALVLTLALASRARGIGSRPWAWTAFLAAVLFSCHVHALGASRGDRGWTLEVFRSRQDLARFWNLRDSQIAWTLR